MIDRSARTRVALAAVAAVVLLGVLAAAVLDGEVVARGHILPWDLGQGREVESLGVRLYLDAETDPDLDVVNSWVIVAIAACCGFAALVGRRTGADARRVRFLAVLAAATLWLAFDEHMGLHETIGGNLRFLGDIPGIDHPDDAIIGFYGIAGLAFLALHRGLLRRSRAAIRAFAVAVALGLASVLGDISERLPFRIEDSLEVVTSLALLGAVALLALDLLSLREARTAASAAPGTPALRPS
jgi:hypothetical protein